MVINKRLKVCNAWGRGLENNLCVFFWGGVWLPALSLLFSIFVLLVFVVVEKLLWVACDIDR